MMRSLFSGVSGLKNHQTRMDVIGNNISNVNTTGFKSSRVNFTDILSQNLQGASAPNGNMGGTNPKQIGLGSAVGAVDLLFTNGSVQSTGVNTDLALSSSNALFILDTGSGTAYTRNGDFQFDADGNYVQAGNGYFVQGWMANNGTIDTGSQVTNITIPSGKSMSPTASTTAVYSNNLDAEVPTIVDMTGGTVIEKGTRIYTKRVEGKMTASADWPVEITMSDGKVKSATDGSYQVDDKYTYVLKKPDDVGESITPSTDNTVIVTFADEGTSAGVNGTPYTIGSTGSYTLTNNGDRATAQSTNSITYTLADGYSATDASGGGYSYVVGETFIYEPTSVTAGPNNIVTAKLKDGSSLTGVSGTSYASGDPVNYHPVSITVQAATNHTVTLTLSDSTTVTGTVGESYTKGGTYSPGVTITDISVDTTVDKLSVESAIKRLDVESEVTQLDVTSKIIKLKQDYPKTVSASADDPATIKLSDGSSIIQTSGLYTEGNSLPIVTTLAVYDTLGSVHDLPVYFTLTSAANDTWSVALTNDGSNTTSWKEADGSTTTVTMDAQPLDFDTNGAYSAGGGKPTITLTNGAAPTQTIQLDFTQMTQYSSSSTIAGKADGNAAGVLSSISIDKTGTITGTYTNGMKQVEAQVALQRFTNPGGLTKVGESLYEDSNNAGRSGEPSTASTLGATITPAALEMSNVDIANEFTDMIITQRGFQGNSKIITVSDEMLETLINLKR